MTVEHWRHLRHCQIQGSSFFRSLLLLTLQTSHPTDLTFDDILNCPGTLALSMVLSQFLSLLAIRNVSRRLRPVRTLPDSPVLLKICSTPGGGASVGLDTVSSSLKSIRH